jgi:hypothetical protein
VLSFDEFGHLEDYSHEGQEDEERLFIGEWGKQIAAVEAFFHLRGYSKIAIDNSFG